MFAVMENNDLTKMYQAFRKWREEHPDNIYIIFDTRLTFGGYPLNRYIVTKGVELYRFFGDVVVSTLSGTHQLHQPITCASQKEATELCQRLNAKYVHDNEPQTFANCPSWREVYYSIFNKLKEREGAIEGIDAIDAIGAIDAIET